MNGEFPNIDYQLFVELEGKIDFLVLVRTSDVEQLSEEQIEAICERAWSLPSHYDKQRTGIVMIDKKGITYRDSTNVELVDSTGDKALNIHNDKDFVYVECLGGVGRAIPLHEFLAFAGLPISE